jgi:plastocyanin
VEVVLRRKETMARGLVVAIVVVIASGGAAMVFLMVAMMGTMMGGGHMGMMAGGGSDPARETAVEGVTEVRLERFAFAPANIVVEVGTTVTWTNRDGVGHTVTSDEGDELASPLFGENDTFSHTFDEPGQYSYHCAPHPVMKGLVTVRAPGDT